MRIRWRFTILWTLVCLAAIATLVDRATRPVSPACVDQCDFDAAFARFVVPLVVIAWLTVTALVTWLWTLATRIRCPNCGRVVEPPVRICPHCSYDLLRGLDTNEDPPGPGEPPAPTP